MTVFHLLRHGEHGLLGRVLAGRMPGVGLTERGRAESPAKKSPRSMRARCNAPARARRSSPPGLGWESHFTTI